MRNNIDKMKRNMEKVLVGKPDVINRVLISLLAKGHVLLEDVPGVGKTTLAVALANTVGCSFNRIQFTPDTLPSDITGTSIYNMHTGKFEFIKGAVMNNIVLADEINRTSPKTQASLLEAMEEGQVTVDGKTHEIPKPFMIIATQNPIEYMGTYRLPEAQMDRFFMRLSIGYPKEEEEKEMIHRFLSSAKWKEILPVVTEEEVLKMQEEVSQIQVHKDLIQYIVTIIKRTRESSDLVLGASPRAMLCLTRGAQAAAYMSGRDFVIPEDILLVVKPILTHRLMISSEALLNKQTVEGILTGILNKIKTPVF